MAEPDLQMIQLHEETNRNCISTEKSEHHTPKAFCFYIYI